MMHRWRIVAVLTSLQAACLAGAPGAPAQSLVEKVRQGAQEGKIAYKLTTPQELQELLGPPDQQERQREGDADLLILQYGAAQAVFAKPGQEAGLPMNVPHILYQLTIKDEPIDIGEQRLIVLRSLDDLEKFDTFWGYAGASLASLDLRDQKAALEKRPFDSRTCWPGLDRLPAGFDPLRRLEKGKSPGLGVPGLHAHVYLEGQLVHLELHRHRVVARETGQAEVLARLPDRLQQAVDAQVAERVRPDPVAYLLDALLRRDQLVAARRVDPVAYSALLY